MNTDVYEKLNLLISEGQFELLPEKGKGDPIRLVFLMNDAVESFLVFHKAELIGTYQSDYEGELQISLGKSEDRHVLVVRQGDQVFTLFFQDLSLEVHLFDYGQTGHFWVKGYEYLRQLEYRIAILRDKRQYLGEDFCSEEEKKLSYLAGFPPLNFCCYPAVPEKYLVPSYPWWQVSEDALKVMYAFAEEAGDKSLKQWLKVYERCSHKLVAKQIARLLHTVRHGAVVDLINHKLTHAASAYEKRVFEGEEAIRIQKIQAAARQREKELQQSGKKVEVLREEPFQYARDSIEYKMHLMIWRTKGKNRHVDVETFE